MSRYEDRYHVETDYEGRHRGAPVAAGVLSERGRGEREYFHGNDPKKISRIEEAEAKRRKIEETYVDFTRSTQDSAARNHLRKAELQSSPYPDKQLQKRALESADWSIESAARQQEIMRKIRALQLEMFGTPE